MSSKKIAAAALSKIRDLQNLIDILNNTTIGSISQDIEEIQDSISDLKKDLISLSKDSTSLQSVKRYIRIKDSLK